MDEIMELADRYHLKVIEDAAQGVNAWYKGRALGTIGDFGCYSFHETKNYPWERAEPFFSRMILSGSRRRSCGKKAPTAANFSGARWTNTPGWDYGSSYLPSDMNAAYLWAQLEEAEKINQKRLEIWNFYHRKLAALARQGAVEQPYVPDYAVHNAHMYYLKVKDLDTRTRLLAWLKERGILKCLSIMSPFILQRRACASADSTGRMCTPPGRARGSSVFPCITA